MKAAIYVRVSTIEQAQEGYSIAAQTSILNEYISALKYDIYNIYQDAGISGKNIEDRPALKRLIMDSELKKFDVIVVWKLSRLSRSLLDLLKIVDIFNQNNISFQSYSEKFDTSTPIGKMLLQLLGSIAEFERNTIADNVKMGLNERFKQGYSKAAIPFGYKHENKQAIIIPEQANAVKHVFDTYLNNPDGNCLTFLAEELNNNGFRTRTGGFWSRVAIRDMLLNHFYKGYVRTGIHSHGYRYKNSNIQKGCHEPIISEKLFYDVNEKLRLKKQKSIIRVPDNDSVLTGLVICPNCGAKMFALNTYNKHINKAGEIIKYPVRIYRCTNRDKGTGTCKGFYVSARKIEPQFMQILNENIEPQHIEKAKSYIKIHNDDLALKRIEKEIKSVTAIKNKYFKLFETNKVKPELFIDKINTLFDNINKLEKEKEDLLSKASYRIEPSKFFEVIKNFITLYDNLTNIERKELLRHFIIKIVLSDSKNIDYVLFTSGLKYYYHK